MVNGLPIPTPQESSIEVFLRVVKEFTNPRTRESFYVALALVLLASIVAAATQRSSYFIAALVVLYVIFVAALTIQNLAVFGDARNKDRTMHRRAAWNIVAIFIFIAVSIGAFITLNSSGLGTNLRILYHWYVTEDPFDKISSRSVNPIPVNINSTSELTKFKVNDFSKYGIEANQTFSKFNVKIPFHLMEQLSQNDKVVFSGNETINLTNVAGEGGLAIVASEIDFDDYTLTH